VDEEPLKVKKSELRLYCDLLMQQVHGVKCAMLNKHGPDIDLLNESTSLLGATCDTFIKTLDECMTLVHAKLDTPPPSAFPELTEAGSTSTSPHSFKYSTSKANNWAQKSGQKTSTNDRYIPGSRTSGSRSSNRSMSRSASETSEQGSLPNTISSFSRPSSARSLGVTLDEAFTDCVDDHHQHGEAGSSNGLSGVKKEDSTDESGVLVAETRLPTFLTKMPVSFLDVRITNDLEIPTVPFLDACRSVLAIFEKLNQTAFIPAKQDIVGNIKKIYLKYTSSPETFTSLQSMVAHEIKLGQCRMSSSATIAILWLTRTLDFIRSLMEEFLKGSEDMLMIVNDSYTRTLRDFHGWVIRSAFAMAVRSVPSKQELFHLLAVEESDTSQPMFTKSLLLDMADQSMALSGIISLLNAFYLDNSLDFSEQV